MEPRIRDPGITFPGSGPRGQKCPDPQRWLWSLSVARNTSCTVRGWTRAARSATMWGQRSAPWRSSSSLPPSLFPSTQRTQSRYTTAKSVVRSHVFYSPLYWEKYTPSNLLTRGYPTRYLLSGCLYLSSRLQILLNSFIVIIFSQQAYV